LFVGSPRHQHALAKPCREVSVTNANCTPEDLVENIWIGLGNKKRKFVFVLETLNVQSEEQKISCGLSSTANSRF